MIGRVTWVDYTLSGSKGVLVRLRVRMEDGSSENLYVEGTEPYIFVPEEERLTGVSGEEFVRVEDGYESIFDHKLKKVVMGTPRQAGDLTEEFSWTGEGDVPYYRRVSIRDGLSGYIDIPLDKTEEYNGHKLLHIDDIETEPETDIDIEPRVCISDIEVRIGEETFETTREEGSQPINVICCYDTYEEDYSVFYYDLHDNLDNPSGIRDVLKDQLEDTELEEHCHKDIDIVSSSSEADMLNEFINYVNRRNFDLTSGWNWIDFDYKYIVRRIEKISEEGTACSICGEDNLLEDTEREEYYCPHHGTVTGDVDKNRLSPFGSTYYSSNHQMTVRGLPAFDLMEAFCDKMTFTNWRSKSLDYVSNEELGVGKIDDVDINSDWEDDPNKLIGYNIADVALTVALDDRNDIHSFFYNVADTSSIPIYDTFYEKRLVDGYVMSRRGDDEILPTAKESEDIWNAGGYVADAVNGRKGDIGVSDLKSLYPSAMITWNISTETISESPDDFDEYVRVPKVPEPKDVHGTIGEDEIDWDWLYCSLDQEGLIPRTLKMLFEKRNLQKSERDKFDPGTPEFDKWDRKQASTKIIMNSFYGNTSSKYWRLSNEYLGDAITSAARYTLWKGRRSIEKIGYEAVYGDTDSHFIQLKEDEIKSQCEELKEISAKMDEDASSIAQDIGVDQKHPYLEDSGLHGDEYTCMRWEPEKIYNSWLQLGKKKRYAGDIGWKEGEYYEEAEISISGFEFRRSDSMEVTAELQQEVIELILTDSEFEEVSEYIRSIIDQIDREHDDVKRFALPGSINKDLDDYPNRQVPRACKYSNKHLGYEFSEGGNPFVYLVNDTPPNLPNTDVVAFEWSDEIPEGFELDKEAIIERGIRKPIDSIIKEVGWNFKELRTGEKQQSFDSEISTSENPFA